MVELATFRMFHRAAPTRQPDPVLEEPIAPVAPVPSQAPVLVDEPASTPFSPELRARRRAARTDLRQSGAWAEPETAPPVVAPGHGVSEPALPAEAPTPVAEVTDIATETSEHALAHVPIDDTQPATPSATGLVEEHAATHPDPVVPDAFAPPFVAVEHALPADEPVPAAEAAAGAGDHTLEHGLVADAEPASENGIGFADEHAAPQPAPSPIEETADEIHLPHAVASPGPEFFEAANHAPGEEDAEPVPDPSVVHPASPVPISEYLNAVQEGPVALPVDLAVAPPRDIETPTEGLWPIEPPSTLLDEHALPIDPPPPLEPETEVASPTAAINQSLPLLETYRSDSLDLDYRLLGLANPAVCTVIGTLGDATPTPMSVGRAGIYRPDGFRPAPWSGFAYDISPDGRTGLVLGTRILTARGEIPVEDLIPGDTALALRGPALLPILWIGRSTASPPPVEIAAGAFGPGRPGRSLRVGADHPIFMETMPVVARDLVNGETIRNVESDTEELFHVDVGFAEVLLAEGIPLASGSR